MGAPAPVDVPTLAPMVAGPLTNDQVEEFVERGWTLLRHAFAPAVAQAPFQVGRGTRS